MKLHPLTHLYTSVVRLFYVGSAPNLIGSHGGIEAEVGTGITNLATRALEEKLVDHPRQEETPLPTLVSSH